MLKVSVAARTPGGTKYPDIKPLELGQRGGLAGSGCGLQQTRDWREKRSFHL